jgi:hypothetical protein
MAYAALDGLTGLLGPLWQIVIAGCLLVVLVIGTHRLIQRGPSRMGHAVLVTGALIVTLAVIGVLTAQFR